MSARKSYLLSKKNLTKEERAAKVAADESFTPLEKLSISPPSVLKKHPLASAMWKKIMKHYQSISGELVTAFDENILIRYVLTLEEVEWLKGIRTSVETEYKAIEKNIAKNRNVKLTDDTYKAYVKALESYHAILARLISIDARVDSKNKFVQTMEISLYLNPRSRAGVAPEAAEPTEPEDEMSKFLSEA